MIGDGWGDLGGDPPRARFVHGRSLVHTPARPRPRATCKRAPAGLSALSSLVCAAVAGWHGRRGAPVTRPVHPAAHVRVTLRVRAPAPPGVFKCPQYQKNRSAWNCCQIQSLPHESPYLTLESIVSDYLIQFKPSAV